MDTYRIVWNDALLIGNRPVDTQHKRLIKIIQSIPEFSTSRDEYVLAEALQYAAEHFSDEEAFMHEIQYPELAAHKNKHKTLTRTLVAYAKEYDQGKTDLYAFKQFMFRWVRDHIMDEDRKIGIYLKACGHPF
jgi:hemerythrin-like metal-binding protein